MGIAMLCWHASLQAPCINSMSAAHPSSALQASQDADACGAERETALAELARHEESEASDLRQDAFWVSRTWLTCVPGHHPSLNAGFWGALHSARRLFG